MRRREGLLSGHLAEELIDEAAAAASYWTGHMILSPPLFFLCLSVLRFPGDHRDLTMSHSKRGDGAWLSKPRVGVQRRGAPPEREQLFSRRSASHNCSFPVQAQLPNYVLTPPHPFPLFPSPAAPFQYFRPHLLPPPWVPAAVGGTINSGWPAFSFPASFLPECS